MIDVITGGHGFVGSRLAKRLPDAVCVRHREIRASILPVARRFFFLSTYGNMAQHDDPWMMLSANIGQLYHVLNSLEEEELESFVYVSSSSVTLPVQTPYSRTKRAGEEMVLAMPIPGCVVRPYSIIGVGEQKEHLIPTLIRSCVKGEPMDFVGEPTHDYVDVEDVVNGLVALANHRAKGVYELGSGISWSNLQVLQLVEKITGRKANIRKVGKLRSYDTWDWRCKNFAARDYGWEPKKRLEQSIREMVESYE